MQENTSFDVMELPRQHNGDRMWSVTLLDEDYWLRHSQRNGKSVWHLLNLGVENARWRKLSQCSARMRAALAETLRAARSVGRQDLQVKLDLHKKWLRNEPGGVRLKLCDANLQWADFHKANLQWADFRDADLQWADFRDADLRWADFRGADLRWADFRDVDFRGQTCGMQI